MIRIRTPSRLHFGLLSLPSALDGAGQRQFGGVGVMIDRPGIELAVERAQTWSAQGPLAERALRFAQSYCAAVGVLDSFDLQITAAAPEHAGLGVGTQLALAVARGIAELTGQAARDAVTLAQQVGRGLRSAVGVHGFERGGFLVEGGKTTQSALSPLLCRHEFPADWPILLITPRGLEGTHGRREIEAFAQLADQAQDERTTENLCRLVLLGLLPALIERDLPTFGEALYEYNRHAGSLFAAAQGGIYAHPRIDEIITTIRAASVEGVGQSSWGPTVFAIADADELASLRDRLLRKTSLREDEIGFAKGCNQGAVLGA
jgi:beta-ribofuranosylaminobenzene 5'-phosphate synthase